MLNAMITETPEIETWDIVTSPYTDINGDRKIGLFFSAYERPKVL